MIEFTISLKVLQGLAGASSANNQKQQAAQAAVHIQRGERCLMFAAQSGQLTVLHRLDDKSNHLHEVCWTDDEERTISLPLRMIKGELEKLPKYVVVSVSHTRVDITPVGSDGTKGCYCERWRVPVQQTLFPDLTKLPAPTPEDLKSIQVQRLDMAVMEMLQKTAKKLGSGIKQPTLTHYGSHDSCSIGVRYGDLPNFYAVVKAFPADMMQCEPPAWLIYREQLPYSNTTISDIFFRTVSEAEKAEREADAEPEPEKKKRGRKPKAVDPAQTAMPVSGDTPGAETPEKPAPADAGDDLPASEQVHPLNGGSSPTQGDGDAGDVEDFEVPDVVDIVDGVDVVDTASVVDADAQRIVPDDDDDSILFTLRFEDGESITWTLRTISLCPGLPDMLSRLKAENLTSLRMEAEEYGFGGLAEAVEVELAARKAVEA